MTEEELAVQNVNALEAATSEEAYADVVQDIQSLVAAVSDVIKKHPILKDKNFSLYYQHGRLGYMDLDVFADKIKIAEGQKSVDKDNE